MKSIDPGMEMTVALVSLAQNRADRQNDLRRKLLKICECDKCRRNLDKNFDYKRFDAILNRNLRNWMVMDNPLVSSLVSKHYSIDWELIEGLRQIYGKYNPYSSELMALSFVCLALYSYSCERSVFKSYDQLVFRTVGVTHGLPHPLALLITDVSFSKL